MKFFSIVIRNSPWLFAIAILASASTGVFSTLTIKLIHETIKSGDLVLSAFALKAGVFLLCYIILGVLSTFLISTITRRTVTTIRLELVNYLLHSKYSKIEHRLQEIFPIITEDVNVLSATIGRLPSTITGLATVVGCFVYLAWLSLPLTFFTLLLFGSVVLINFSFLPRTKRLSTKSRNIWSLIYRNFEGLVYGIKELKMNAQHKRYFLEEQFTKNQKEENKYRIMEAVNFSTSSKIADAFLLAGICTILAVIHEYEMVSFDFFSGFLTVILFALSPMSNAMGFLRHMKRSEVSLDKIEDLGLEMNLIQEEDKDISLPKDINHPIITLNKATFTYETSAEFSFTVGPIDLAIENNEIVYITGGNGSGKTTLLKMLCGLYPLQDGRISYCGTEITNENESNYRDKFSGVFTEFFLFQDIGYLDKLLTKDVVDDMLSRLELTHKVSLDSDRNYSTIDLSLGQRKRLALLTAALEGRDLLVFDEWAANQDPHFKKMFYEQLIPYFKQIGKTVIAITHDDQYFAKADKVISLSEGKMISVD